MLNHHLILCSVPSKSKSPAPGSTTRISKHPVRLGGVYSVQMQDVMRGRGAADTDRRRQNTMHSTLQ
jgi:hypothetical protein